jgi:DNA adenine methylase
MRSRFWMVSYDNTLAIKNLYSGFRSLVYNVGYTAREHRVGKEVMFFAPKLQVPDLIGPVQQIGKIREAA